MLAFQPVLEFELSQGACGTCFLRRIFGFSEFGARSTYTQDIYFFGGVSPLRRIWHRPGTGKFPSFPPPSPFCGPSGGDIYHFYRKKVSSSYPSQRSFPSLF